ncbi:endonuclease [Bacteroides sp. 214]|uniref:endonuclease/exonuclease/phosphatase family protein n=1 Tax=Bacteroides sp. 214 TaxID=2302935 RepID=UPI0013D6F66E|nr:endonuclease/exonuclease/phosphatase family protein [Bacteroides sp. 214]NDW13546.1 endonuclease [Bacteroides sp. 214]
MKKIGNLALGIIFVVNILFVGGLLFAAFSPYINPVSFPILSCAGLTFPIFLTINCCFVLFWFILRWKYAMLSVLAMLICCVQIKTYIPINFSSNKTPEGTIKLLSYNVMAFGDLKKTAGQNDILTYIKNSNADVICLQEFIVASNRKYLTRENINKELKNYPYRDEVKLGEANTNGLAFYSKFPILSSRRINYESEHNGSIVYEIKVGNDTIVVINNHLESNKLSNEDKGIYKELITSPETAQMKQGAMRLLKKLGEAAVIRSKQADAIAKEIANSPHKTVICCGDFNESPISYSHRVISENLTDAFVQSGTGLGISYNRGGFYFRIDNILISKNLKSYSCTVDRSIKTSDHYPMWCYISKN